MPLIVCDYVYHDYARLQSFPEVRQRGRGPPLRRGLAVVGLPASQILRESGYTPSDEEG